MKDIINSVIAMLKGGSSNSTWSRIKMPLYILLALATLYGVVYLAAGKERPLHSDKLLLQKIDSLQKVAAQLQQNQTVTLGNDLILYKNISKLQTQIDSLKGVRSVINNYYGARGNTIRTLQAKQLDSFFRQRYNY